MQAIKQLLEKEAPGIVHRMLSESLSITQMAALARPVAGVIGSSLVITLPGSPKGAVENMMSVIGILPHSLALLANVSSRELHRKSPAEQKDEFQETPLRLVHLPSHSHTHSHSHSHSHSHDHSHDHSHAMPVKHLLASGNVTSRSRSSPFPMISVEEALSRISENTPLSNGYIQLPLHDKRLAGSVIFEDIYAPEHVPNYRASIVDGYAVVDLEPGTYPVALVSHASGSNATIELKSGSIARVTTGAPVPPGTKAVIMVEETVLISKTDDGTEEKEVEILAKGALEGENIREVGSDIKKGSLVLSKGTIISFHGGEIGMLASLGLTDRVKVFSKPVVGVMSTGDEVVDTLKGPVRPLKYGEIYDSNRPTLLKTIRGWGYETVDCGIVLDTDDELENAMRKQLERVDVLITTGGVSMGELDLLKPTISNKLGGTLHFGRVAMKPGKPTTFATMLTATDDDVSKHYSKKLIFALPGNPASASVTFHLFVLPSLRQMSGISRPDWSLPAVKVELAEDFKLDPRPEYHRVSISQRGTSLVAESTGGQRSSRIGSMKGANGLLVLPSSKDVSTGILRAGFVLDAMLIGMLSR